MACSSAGTSCSCRSQNRSRSTAKSRAYGWIAHICLPKERPNLANTFQESTWELMFSPGYVTALGLPAYKYRASSNEVKANSPRVEAPTAMVRPESSFQTLLRSSIKHVRIVPGIQAVGYLLARTAHGLRKRLGDCCRVAYCRQIRWKLNRRLLHLLIWYIKAG